MPTPSPRQRSTTCSPARGRPSLAALLRGRRLQKPHRRLTPATRRLTIVTTTRATGPSRVRSATSGRSSTASSVRRCRLSLCQNAKADRGRRTARRTRVLQSRLLPGLPPVLAIKHRQRVARCGQDVPAVPEKEQVYHAELALLPRWRREAGARRPLQAQHGQEGVPVRPDVRRLLVTTPRATLTDMLGLPATLPFRSPSTRTGRRGARSATSASTRTPTPSRTVRGTRLAPSCQPCRGDDGLRRAARWPTPSRRSSARSRTTSPGCRSLTSSVATSRADVGRVLPLLGGRLRSSAGSSRGPTTAGPAATCLTLATASDRPGRAVAMGGGQRRLLTTLDDTIRAVRERALSPSWRSVPLASRSVRQYVRASWPGVVRSRPSASPLPSIASTAAGAEILCCRGAPRPPSLPS